MGQVSEQPASIVSLARHLSPGQYKKACPVCQGTRRKNASDRPLSVLVDSKGVKYSCHHCDAEGGWVHENADRLFTAFPMPPSPFQPIKLAPCPTNFEELGVAYLRGRGITDSVIEAHTVRGGYQFNGKVVAAVGFPYKQGTDIVAIKWRSADTDKKFSQENKCEDMFLLDSYEPGNDILICEGEIDALAWLSAGLPDNVSVVSIPNGAPARVRDGKVDPKDDNKFAYLWRAKEKLDLASRIYVNADNDGPGRALAEEISRRVDRKKLWSTSLGDFKDAAEALSEGGSSFLLTALESSIPVPLVGLHTADDFCDQFQVLYENGLTKGASTGITSLDKLMTVAPGMVTVVTGFPGCGKSDLIDQVCINLAKERDWKTVYCSFEKPVELHMAQLSEKFIGKPFFDGATQRMTPSDRDYATDWLSKHFMFMDYRKGGPSDIDGILETASAAVMRMGCRILVIDPYNYLAIDRSVSETSVISDILTKIRQWAKVHHCHVFFVAHPAKVGGDRLGKKLVVGGHEISGSAAWFAKADFGLTVWRDMKGGDPPEAHIWKVKWSWLGRIGATPLCYEPITSRWSDIGGVDDDFDWSF